MRTWGQSVWVEGAAFLAGGLVSEEDCYKPAEALKAGSWENRCLDGTTGHTSPWVGPCRLEWRKVREQGVVLEGQTHLSLRRWQLQN